MHSRHQFKGLLRPGRPAKGSDSSARRVITNKPSLGAAIMSTSRNECLILVVSRRKAEMMAASQNYRAMRPSQGLHFQPKETQAEW